MRNLEGNGKEVQRASIPAVAGDTAAPAANTAAVVTYPAVAAKNNGVVNMSNVIGKVVWSYNGTPTGGSLKIEDGSGNIVFGPHYITAGGPGDITFDSPKKGSADTALIVTLAAGGAGISGAVSCTQWTEPTTIP